jgi:hypothetical protein
MAIVGGTLESVAGKDSSSLSLQPKVLLRNALSLKSFKSRGKTNANDVSSKGVRPHDVIPLDENFKNF